MQLLLTIALFTSTGLADAAQQSVARDMKAAIQPAQAAGTTQARRPPIRLITTQKEALLRRCFPAVDDPEAAAILVNPELIIYTEAEMPKVYQFWDGLMPGVHLVNYNISADNSEPFGNGNHEFPWGKPAGTHRAPGVSSFRFLLLPRDEQGRLRPIVWYPNQLPGERRSGYAWTFPVGTVFGEVLTLRGPDRRDYTFEVRIRTRIVGQWEVDVLRPFPTAADLAERVKQLRPDWQQQPQLVKLCQHCQSAKPLTERVLADRQPRRRVFRQQMGVDYLPEISDPKLIGDLLIGTKFRSALGATWRDAPNGAETHAPTTAASFHVVPAGYDAGFVAVDSQSCARCHDSVNKLVRDFNAGRDWYGRIRGSDGIFSFHPFAIGCISCNGGSQSVSLRRELVQAGVLERYSARRHPSRVYHELERGL